MHFKTYVFFPICEQQQQQQQSNPMRSLLKKHDILEASIVPL